MPGVADAELAEAAQMSSLADETPEGRSIVTFAEEHYGLAPRDLPNAELVAFTAQTRMSGLDMDGRSVAIRPAPPPDVDRAARAAAAHAHGGGPADVVAPMPGSVLAVHVAVGDTIAAGDPIVTLEAMKMEHIVAASGPGRVTELVVRPGDQVTRGGTLATIEA